jgi:hypothetical protein
MALMKLHLWMSLVRRVEGTDPELMQRAWGVALGRTQAMLPRKGEDHENDTEPSAE